MLATIKEDKGFMESLLAAGAALNVANKVRK
jgi:hypothetical protein